MLKKLGDNGFTKQDLKSIQTLIEAEDSDIFDVLEHIAYSKKPIQRAIRVANAENKIHSNLDSNQKEFIDFVLSKYVEGGVDELRQRVRKLEKTVWGASAVVAAALSILGLAIAADSKTMEDIPTFEESDTKVGVFTDQIRRYEIERERTPAKFVIDKALLEWLQWEQ